MFHVKHLITILNVSRETLESVKPMAKCNVVPYTTDENQLTNQTFLMHFYRLERIALNAVKWDNLPESISQAVLERYLFYFGAACFFLDEIIGDYMILPVTGMLKFDQNGLPTEWVVTGMHGYTRVCNSDNAVIIYNDYNFSPSNAWAAVFSGRLTNALRTCDMHLEMHKVGKVIRVPETLKNSVKNLLTRVKNFHLFSVISPSAGNLSQATDMLNAQPENYVLDKLDNHYTFIWHEALSFFGVNSVSDKKSGMTSEEVGAESNKTSVEQDAIINPRSDAAERINKMFGLNIKVSISKGGVYNVYNRTEDPDGGTNRENNTL